MFTASDDSGSYITGLDSTSMDVGSTRTLCNVDSKNDDGIAVLSNQDTHSLVANRFLTPGSGDVHTHRSDYYIGPNTCVDLIYLAADPDDGTFRAWVVRDGTQRVAAVVARQLQFYGAFYATAISGSIDNYDPTPIAQYTCLPLSYACYEAGNSGSATESSLLMLQTVDTTGATLTGLNYVSGVPQSNGPIKILFNLGPGNITLKNSATSTTINQFMFAPAGNEYDVVLKPNRTPVMLYHERDSGRWVVIGHSDNVFDAKVVTMKEGLVLSQGASTYGIDVQRTGSALTAAGYTLHVLDSASYNTTSGAINNYGAAFVLNGTRSTGANSVNNTAVYANANASTGVVNYAIFTDNGKIHFGDAVDMSSTLNMSTHQINNLATPSIGGDAVNKTYADGLVTTAISGTTNRITKFTSANVVGNSLATDDGTTYATNENTTLGTTTSNAHTLWGTSLFQTAASTAVTIERHGGGAGLHFKNSNGTLASPTASTGAGGVLGQIQVTGYGTNAYQGNYPAYQINPSETWTNTANGFQHQWYVNTTGTQTNGVAMELLATKQLHGYGTALFDGNLNLSTGGYQLGGSPASAIVCVTSGNVPTWNGSAWTCVTPSGGGITNGAGNNIITKSNGTNLVASSIGDDGTSVTINTNKVVITESTGAMAIAGNVSIGSNWVVTASSGDMVTGNIRAANGAYLNATTPSYDWDFLTNGTSKMLFNNTGYAGGTTQFRDFEFRDGKGAAIMTGTGSTKAVTFAGAVTAGGGLAVTGTATTDKLKFSSGGVEQVKANGLSPTSCGTSPTATGDATAGTFTTGTGATTCVIPLTFATAPYCDVQMATAGAKAYGYTLSTSGISMTAVAGSQTFYWHCSEPY